MPLPPGLGPRVGEEPQPALVDRPGELGAAPSRSRPRRSRSARRASRPSCGGLSRASGSLSARQRAIAPDGRRASGTSGIVRPSVAHAAPAARQGPLQHCGGRGAWRCRSRVRGGRRTAPHCGSRGRRQGRAPVRTSSARSTARRARGRRGRSPRPSRTTARPGLSPSGWRGVPVGLARGSAGRGGCDRGRRHGRRRGRAGGPDPRVAALQAGLLGDLPQRGVPGVLAGSTWPPGCSHRPRRLWRCSSVPGARPRPRRR
jgi:hypothetical protein